MEVINKVDYKFMPVVVKPKFFQEEITTWLEECEGGSPTRESEVMQQVFGKC